MTTDYDLFGADIALGDNFQAHIAANGELVLCEGHDCAVQHIALRLYVFLGSLFYDVDYGSLVLQWVREESTPGTREGLCVEVERRVNVDPHVVPGSATCAVQAWDHQSVTLDLTFTLVDAEHPDLLVLRLGANDNGSLAVQVVKHANPRENSRP